MNCVAYAKANIKMREKGMPIKIDNKKVAITIAVAQPRSGGPEKTSI